MEESSGKQLMAGSIEPTNTAGNSPKYVCTIERVSSGPVRLGIIPIQVEIPRGMVQAVAFLDSGSDTTLVRESFAREHDLGGQTTSLVISTVNEARAVRASQLSLKFAPTSGEDTIQVHQAFTIAEISMRPSKSIRSLAWRWPHLHVLAFENVPDTRVDILIGCDVPEAQWVLDQRTGDRRDPYAVRTMFGRILCGPLGHDGNYSASINFISRSDNRIEHDQYRLYNHEFGDIADDRAALAVNGVYGKGGIIGDFNPPEIEWTTESATLELFGRSPIQILHPNALFQHFIGENG
ncbi:unnamed protein product [Echinostoma caproni]|uniref:Peptidase A2 domain-containing protein n=1 Tax=Echinostoma caproni TaxID=27848 RepID=A0A183ALL0_9TREM|nr:unnamed protein product [Echinostoma caproni]